ncbi:hypothetical protein ACE6H2_027884 [Prunus campanulata]
MTMRELMTGGVACAVPGSSSSANPFSALANALISSSSKTGLNDVIFSCFRSIHEHERLKEIPHPHPQLMSRNFIHTLIATCYTRSERMLKRTGLRRTKRPFQGQPNHTGMIQFDYRRNSKLVDQFLCDFCIVGNGILQDDTRVQRCPEK